MNKYLVVLAVLLVAAMCVSPLWASAVPDHHGGPQHSQHHGGGSQHHGGGSQHHGGPGQHQGGGPGQHQGGAGHHDSHGGVGHHG
ncbi:dormancy-associated protein 2-like [Schistocerca americana]|uniref:dormancy-associated protein 2-like n=1 Tax=Schistocerca americana TaxID=7009 RepID=UPI001F4FB6FE|nr:dormancy-associated protein 2-like [Schistocerca americana]XP_049786787.1 uncharacterized protein LOC126189014 [Schistocerca cancellata]